MKQDTQVFFGSMLIPLLFWVVYASYNKFSIGAVVAFKLLPEIMGAIIFAALIEFIRKALNKDREITWEAYVVTFFAMLIILFVKDLVYL